ncbi:MAG: leucine zipper domain-containing protein [Gemmatimonadaceae bacterium]
MSQRHEFVRRVLQRRETMAELCSEFRVSEKTGYKWMSRFRADGAAGLDDRSHAPHHVDRMADSIATELLAIRATQPTWGPRKLIAYAAARDAARAWPAPRQCRCPAEARGAGAAISSARGAEYDPELGADFGGRAE